MNYENIYHEICKRGQGRKKVINDGLERHHIIPKSCGGDNSAENITVLTAAEHYLCHKLLVKIYKNNPVFRKKMVYALWWMSKTRSGSASVTSRDYMQARLKFLEDMPTKQAGHKDRFRRNHAQGKYKYDYGKVSQTLTTTLSSLSKEQMAARMKNSARKCDHEKRARSIAKGKGSQIQITGPDQSTFTVWSYEDTEKICGLKWSQIRYRINAHGGRLPDGSHAAYKHRYTGNDARRI